MIIYANYGLNFSTKKTEWDRKLFENYGKSLKLIKLYTHICEFYESELQWEVQRSPNEQQGQITDRSSGPPKATIG